MQKAGWSHKERNIHTYLLYIQKTKTETILVDKRNYLQLLLYKEHDYISTYYYFLKQHSFGK